MAIIMDGNGRWARARGLSRAEGHREGVKALRRVVEAAQTIGIRYLTVYAFSTENWRRPHEEVEVLMDLLVEYLQKEVPELRRQGVRLRTIGHLEELPERCRRSLKEALDLTAEGENLTLTLALNYGGRRDLADAAALLARGVQRGDVTPEHIDEEMVGRYLSTRDLPDPDLIIRPSGEWRLSNFLLWEAAYAELYMTPVFWPEFSEGELRAAIQAYRSRERRFGGLGEHQIEVDRP